MSIALVVLISVAVLVLTAIKTDRLPAVLLSLAFLLRLLVFIADYYHLAPIPFSGSDTEDFHVATLAYVAGDGPIKTNYTYVLAFFYRIFGAGGRMMAQFFNVLLSYGTVVLLYATLRWLKVKPQVDFGCGRCPFLYARNSLSVKCFAARGMGAVLPDAFGVCLYPLV